MDGTHTPFVPPATPPTQGPVHWQAKDANSNPLGAGAVTITADRVDAAIIPEEDLVEPGDHGSRNDADVDNAPYVVNVLAVDITAPAFIPLNDDYDENNRDQNNNRVADNVGNWDAVSGTPSAARPNLASWPMTTRSRPPR